MGEINWAVVEVTVAATFFAIWLYLGLRNRPPFWAWFVSFGHLFVASTSAAAPFRSLLDPHYPGYRFGFVASNGGVGTMLITSAIVLSAATSAFLAVRGRGGYGLWFVKATSALFLMNLGGSWLESVLQKLSDTEMQFGEYLTIPPIIAAPLMFVIFICPFLVGIGWEPQRAHLHA
jgi:hypothetical protein